MWGEACRLDAAPMGEAVLEIVEGDPPPTRVHVQDARSIEVHAFADVTVGLKEERDPCDEVDVVDEPVADIAELRFERFTEIAMSGAWLTVGVECGYSMTGVVETGDAATRSVASTYLNLGCGIGTSAPVPATHSTN